jgi:hypothetical protein
MAKKGHLAIKNEPATDKRSKQSSQVKNIKPQIQFVDESDQSVQSAIDKSKSLIEDETYSKIIKKTNKSNSIQELKLENDDSDIDNASESNTDRGMPQLQLPANNSEAENMIRLSSSSSSSSEPESHKQEASSKSNLSNFDDLLDIDFNFQSQPKPTVETLIANSFNLIDISEKQINPVIAQPPTDNTDLISGIEDLSFKQKVALFQSNVSSSSTNPIPHGPTRSSISVASTANSILNPVKPNELENTVSNSRHDSLKSILNEFDPFSDKSMFSSSENNEPMSQPSKSSIPMSQTMQAISKRSGMIAPPLPPLPNLHSTSTQFVPKPNYNVSLPTTPMLNQNTEINVPNQGINNRPFYNHFAPTPFPSSMSHPNLNNVYRPVQFNYGAPINNQQSQQQPQQQQQAGSQFLASALFSAGTSLSSVVTASTIMNHQQNPETFNPNDLL